VKVQKGLINRKIQNNTTEGVGGEVTDKCYSMVKIACVGPGHKRNIIMWNKRQGNTKRGSRLAGLCSISVPNRGEVAQKVRCLTKVQFGQARNLYTMISFRIIDP
jgi:hypothetical protein